jgi:hypothetical protein
MYHTDPPRFCRIKLGFRVAFAVKESHAPQ